MRDIEIIEKSLLSFNVQPDRELKKCIIEIKDFKDGVKEHVMEKKSDGRFEYPKLAIKDSCSYSIRLIDNDDIENSSRIFYNIRVLPDNLPIINVGKPTNAGYYSHVSKMRWSLSVTDDYGIEEIFMSYKVIVPGEGREQKVQKKGVLPLAKVQNKLSLSTGGLVNLPDLKLQPGVVLSLQFEAKDSSPFRENGQTGKSQTINLNIVSPADIIAENFLNIIKTTNTESRNMRGDLAFNILFEEENSAPSSIFQRDPNEPVSWLRLKYNEDESGTTKKKKKEKKKKSKI